MSPQMIFQQIAYPRMDKIKSYNDAKRFSTPHEELGSLIQSNGFKGLNEGINLIPRIYL